MRQICISRKAVPPRLFWFGTFGQADVEIDVLLGLKRVVQNHICSLLPRILHTYLKNVIGGCLTNIGFAPWIRMRSSTARVSIAGKNTGPRLGAQPPAFQDMSRYAKTFQDMTSLKQIRKGHKGHKWHIMAQQTLFHKGLIHSFIHALWGKYKR